MCDYSLMSVPNRLAMEGEELVVHRFASGAMGLASPVDLQPDRRPLIARIRSAWSDSRRVREGTSSRVVAAVCIPPGARLRVSDISDSLQREIDIRCTEEVTFTQISASPFQYRDAIQFRNGRQLLLQRLEPGQRVRVLTLSLAAFAESHSATKHRAGCSTAPLPLGIAARGEVSGVSRLGFPCDGCAQSI